MFVGWRSRLSFAIGYFPNRRFNDGFIIAHPRSGSTWLRTIITNILEPDVKSNPDVFNSLIPGVSFRNVKQIRNLTSPRIMTSHTMYLPGLPKVIYMVRDGRDVLVSYYHYMVFRQSRFTVTERNHVEPVDFATFINRYYRGFYGHIWDKHVLSWLDNDFASDNKRFLLVRYEDLSTDTSETLLRVTKFLGIPASINQIACAIDDANINRVRKIEQRRWQKKGLGVPDSKVTFYGVGGKRPVENYFTSNALEAFSIRSEKALQLAGYNHL
jgi:hypothetical protein